MANVGSVFIYDQYNMDLMSHDIHRQFDKLQSCPVEMKRDKQRAFANVCNLILKSKILSRNFLEFHITLEKGKTNIKTIRDERFTPMKQS